MGCTSISKLPPAASPVPNQPVVAVSPRPANLAQQQAAEFNNRGAKKIGKADYQGAIKDFTQAIQLNPQFSEAYVGRGITYSVLKKHQAAIKDYNRATQLNPTLAVAYLYRADDYAALGEKKKAIADLQKAAGLFTRQGDSKNARLAENSLLELQNPVAAEPVVAPVSSSSAATSVPAETALALHLKQTKAKMYGTYWCSACNWQRRKFGEAAFSQIDYVECDPRGSNPRPALCRQAMIWAYPTWEIKGEIYPSGGMPLEELADVSGYQGPRNFVN